MPDTGTMVDVCESKVAEPGGAKSRESLQGPAGVGAVANLLVYAGWLKFTAMPIVRDVLASRPS